MGSSENADHLLIENFLVEKLKDALDELQKTAKRFPVNLSGIASAFEQLKQSVESDGPNHIPKPREKLHKLDNLLSEWRIYSKKKNKYSLESLTFVRNFAKDLSNIKEELDGVSISSTSNGEKPTSRTEEEAQDFRWSNRAVDVKRVYGIHDKAVSLQKLIVSGKESDDRRFSMIGFVGMRGVGKTTMAQLLFDKPEVKKHFLPRIWVCASKQPEALEEDFDPRIEIVKRMLLCLGLEEGIVDSARKHGLKELLFALRLQLRGKRYLIVLDDVWRKLDDKEKDEKEKDFFSTFCSSLDRDEKKCNDTHTLAYGLPKECGGAVIVTSRNEKLVIDMVGEENMHIVKPLKDPLSCWNIFKDSARQIDEVAEDERAENTASANGHVVDQQGKDQVGEISASASNGHVDLQVQNQTQEDSVSANGQGEKPVEDSTDGKIPMVDNSDKQEDDPLEKEFEELKEKIIHRCAGLPLAAKMMGEIARESRKSTTGGPKSGQLEQQQATGSLDVVPKSDQSDEQHREED